MLVGLQRSGRERLTMSAESLAVAGQGHVFMSQKIKGSFMVTAHQNTASELKKKDESTRTKNKGPRRVEVVSYRFCI